MGTAPVEVTLPFLKRKPLPLRTLYAVGTRALSGRESGFNICVSPTRRLQIVRCQVDEEE